MVTNLGTVTQGPNDNLDYSIGWSGVLSGDSIQSSEWTLPAGINKSNEVFSENMTSIFLRGGTSGQSYEILNKITTVMGRVAERVFTLSIT